MSEDVAASGTSNGRDVKVCSDKTCETDKRCLRQLGCCVEGAQRALVGQESET